MFNKKSCNKCGKKVDKNFEYCPHCGSFAGDQEKEQRDYGFIGKNDAMKDELKLPFGFNTIFGKLMREMDKQFKQLDKEIGKEGRNLPKTNDNIKKGGISINISSGAGKPVINVRSFGNMPEFKEMEGQFKGKPPMKKKLVKPIPIPMDEGKARKLAKLPREEAASKVRRLSGKVVYEIDLPEVKNSKDIIIQQLENSIEIKAFAKDKAYFKFLPVNLPLERYKFSNGKLTLELGEK